jgi:16S rRNA (uracil1498-N3)-methyltransferase
LTSNHFFIEKNRLKGKAVVLTGAEHHHLSKVVRHKPKDVIWLFDEGGAKYKARIDDISTEETRLTVLERIEDTRPKTKVTLAQALLKGKSMDFVVHKAVELGIFGLIPVVAARSVVKIEERSEKKIERWTKIALEASKQCQSGLTLRIAAPIKLADFLRETTRAPLKIVLSKNADLYLKDLITSPDCRSAAASEMILLVGPEGGWTPEEERKIMDSGFKSASLGKNILRAETASLAAAAILLHFWNW